VLYQIILTTDLGGGMKYYIQYLNKPLEVLSTRYSSQGILSESFSIIKENLLLGVGFASISGEFIGDSFIFRYCIVLV